MPYTLQWDGKGTAAPVLPARLECSRSCGDGGQRLILGDNLPVMEALLEEGAAFDFVYLDPPFNTGQVWLQGGPRSTERAAVYRDRRSAEEYLTFLWERLQRVHRLLQPWGSLVLHVDWRAVHLAQVLLDEIFGRGEREQPGAPGFRCEVVWGYGGGGAHRRTYRRKHDNLLWYSRGEEWIFQPQFRPYTEKTRKRGLTAVKGPDYRLRDEGASLESWWTGPEVQKILSPTAAENLKYPTQKPESLLERLLRVHTRPGDLVGDFFCGSGTTGAVAARLGRRWVLCDAAPAAVELTERRLAACRGETGGFGVWQAVNDSRPAKGEAG